MEPPLSPVPVRAVIPVFVGAVLGLIVFLIISVFCVVAGVRGDGTGWGMLIITAPFTYFLGYAVHRIPRRLAELRRWEQHLRVSGGDPGAAEFPEEQDRPTPGLDGDHALTWLRRRHWRTRWFFAAMLVLTVLGLVLRWGSTGWVWKVLAGLCASILATSLVLGWRQARRDHRAVNGHP